MNVRSPRASTGMNWVHLVDPADMPEKKNGGWEFVLKADGIKEDAQRRMPLAVITQQAVASLCAWRRPTA